MPAGTDESNIGIWLGMACVALALLPWIGFDWWLKRHHHEFITVEVRELLQAKGPGGLIFCAIVGAIIAIALYHFFYQRMI